ncbi:hypothetical protein ACFSOZ_33270 [Mesorhizobium newzealandense]|uniref:Uncharacterized protein n=1 Tax=Mesorhizobium newzealandense TaxID=1300302 RepID=A0ABW4UM03_9HYPH
MRTRRQSGGCLSAASTIIDLPNSHLQYAMTWYALPPHSPPCSSCGFAVP